MNYVTRQNRGTPEVSIGLPVYNGQRYLGAALDSILAQSFSSFEVLIADNASNDGTAAIAQDYVERDARIRYYRHAVNLGAARNFNFTFHETSGKYFKWAAHDDLMHPDFLARCIEALKEAPSAVLAYPKVTIIDEHGIAINNFMCELALDAQRPSERFRSLIYADHRCFPIFGIVRRDALDRTNLIGLHAHGDGVLLGHLALLGPFIEVDEFLFLPRAHPGHSTRMTGNSWAYAEWFDPSVKGKVTFPWWRIMREYLRTVGTAPISQRERWAVCGDLSLWFLRYWHLFRGDILYHLRPLLARKGIPERLLRRHT